MDELKNETVEVIEEDTPEEELTAETDWEAETKKARGIAQRLRTKLAKATEKKVEKVESKVEPVKEVQKTGELDETQLDYLDLKGISDQDQIDVIQRVMRNTGQTLRQVLKDEYVVSRMEAIKKEKEVKDATPGSTKRSGAQADSLDTAIAKYEQSGKLPDDFALASKIVNALSARDNANKPKWRS